MNAATEPDRAFHAPSLALAVLAAAATCAISLVVVGLLHSGNFIGVMGLIVVPAYFLGALVVAAALGLPMLLILRALGLLNLWTTLLIGAVLGAAVGWISVVDEWVFDVTAWTISGTLSALASRSVWMWSQRRYATRELHQEERRNFMQ